MPGYGKGYEAIGFLCCHDPGKACSSPEFPFVELVFFNRRPCFGSKTYKRPSMGHASGDILGGDIHHVNFTLGV